MNRAKKNKLLLAVLAIALFIPTVVAIVNYSRAKTGPVNTQSIVTMTMSDLDGNRTVFDKENPDGYIAGAEPVYEPRAGHCAPP